MLLIRRTTDCLKKPHVLLLVGLCSIAAFLSFHRLGYHSLWCDEAVSFFVAEDDVSTIVRHTLRYERPLIDVNPPAYWLVLHLVMKFGSSEWWLRLPSALFGMMLVPVLYMFWRTLFSTDVAILAIALVVLSPAYVFYCQNARVYTMMLLLFYLACVFLLRALESDNPWHWRVYCGLITLGLYTTYLTGFLIVTSVAVVALWSLYAARMERKAVKRKWLHFLLSLALAVGLAAPAAPGYLVARSQSSYADQPFTSGFFRSFRDEYFWFSDWRFYVLAGFIIAGFAYGLARYRRSTLIASSLVVVPVIFAELSRPLYFVPRHILFIMPALLMLMALGVKLVANVVAAAPLWRNCARRISISVFAFLAVVYAMTYAPKIKWHYSVPLQNWRDAVPYVRAHAQPGDTIVTGLYYVQHCFYYYDRASWTRYNFRNRIFAYDAFRDALLAPTRVWYVTSFQNQIPEKYLAVVRQHMQCQNVVRGRGGATDVYIYFRDGR